VDSWLKLIETGIDLDMRAHLSATGGGPGKRQMGNEELGGFAEFDPEVSAVVGVGGTPGDLRQVNAMDDH